MALPLKILTYPHSSLRKKTLEIDFEKDVQLDGFISSMTDSLVSIDRGAALSANQVGLDLRIFVINPSALKFAPEHVKARFDGGNEVVNPKIISVGDKKEVISEGCLSFPGLSISVPRATSVTVEFFNRSGEKKELSLEGFWAQVFQHEIDHLDGKLFVDYLSHREKFKIREMMQHLR